MISRGTLETSNLITAGRTLKKGELSTKYVFTETGKKGLCLQNTAYELQQRHNISLVL